MKMILMMPFLVVFFLCFGVVNAKVKTSGFADLQLGTNFFSEQESSKQRNASENLEGRANTSFSFEASDRNNFTEYGMRANLIAGSNASFDEGGANMNEALIFIKPLDGGLSEIGVARIATEKMRLDASTFTGGTGGIDGDWFRFVNLPIVQGAYQPVFLLTPRMMTSSGFTNENFLTPNGNTTSVQPRLGWGDDAVKISYYTKRYEGFKFGFSFTPNTNDNFASFGGNGTQNTASNGVNVGANLQNSTAFAINYGKQIDNLTINASVLSEIGNIRYKEDVNVNQASLQRKNLRSVSAGFNMSYAGLHLGGSYSNFGNSFYFQNIPNTSKADSYQYNVGAGYSFGPFNVSLGYLQSQFMSNRVRNTVFSVERTLAKTDLIKFKQYLELSSYQLSFLNANQRVTNHGVVLISGMQIEF